MKRISIMKCARHNVYAISIDDESGGTRLTPMKCCGSWTTTHSWPITERMIETIAEELKLDPRGEE